jgi:hypothetical protein
VAGASAGRLSSASLREHSSLKGQHMVRPAPVEHGARRTSPGQTAISGTEIFDENFMPRKTQGDISRLLLTVCPRRREQETGNLLFHQTAIPIIILILLGKFSC